MPGPYLQARLLRQPEQEVREVETVAACGGQPARRVQPGEDEAAARVRIGAVARGVPSIVAAQPQGVTAERPGPGVGRGHAAIDASRRIEIAHARETAERQIRDAPVERVGGDPGDPRVAGDVLDVRILVDRRRRRAGQIDREVVQGPAMGDVQRDRDREVGALVVPAERREHVGALAIAAPELHLPVQQDGGALLAASAPARSAAAAESAAPGAAPRRARSEVVRNAAADVVPRRLGRRRVVIVARGAGQVRRGNVLQQRARRRAHRRQRNLIAGERQTGPGIDELCRRGGEVTGAHRLAGDRCVLIEEIVAAIAVVGHRDVRLAGAVVDAGDLERAAEGAAEILSGVRRASGARVGAQLIGRGVEWRAAEGVVGGGVVGVLTSAPRAEREVAAPTRAPAARSAGSAGTSTSCRSSGPASAARTAEPAAPVTLQGLPACRIRPASRRWPDRTRPGPSPRSARPACRDRGWRYCR